MYRWRRFFAVKKVWIWCQGTIWQYDYPTLDKGLSGLNDFPILLCHEKVHWKTFEPSADKSYGPCLIVKGVRQINRSSWKGLESRWKAVIFFFNYISILHDAVWSSDYYNSSPSSCQFTLIDGLLILWVCLSFEELHWIYHIFQLPRRFHYLWRCLARVFESSFFQQR